MPAPNLERLERTIREHENWRLRECLNLEPAENRSSDLLRSMYLSDLGNRYSDPEKFHKGTRYIDELVSFTEDLARKVFNARYADIRPLSGHVADLTILLSLTKQGDRVISVHPDKGGYPGIADSGLGRILGLENLYFPFDDEAVNIKVRESSQILRSESPKVAFFGASFMTFPHPIRQLSSEGESIRVYDGSHVLGLIAGGIFQDPLREGCPLLVGSTHKSFPGPQGGIVLSNSEEVFSAVTKGIYPGMVDNIHLDRVAALCVALLEMKQFGRAYAESIVKNSQALAKALVDRGVQVRGARFGYTKSHQVLMDYDVPKLESLAVRLEQANIISDSGGRLGTSEMTRLGYGPGDMDEVAELVSYVVLGKKEAGFVQKRVRSLVKHFQEPKFVLKSVPRPLG